MIRKSFAAALALVAGAAATEWWNNNLSLDRSETNIAPKNLPTATLTRESSGVKPFWKWGDKEKEVEEKSSDSNSQTEVSPRVRWAFDLKRNGM